VGGRSGVEGEGGVRKKLSNWGREGYQGGGRGSRESDAGSREFVFHARRREDCGLKTGVCNCKKLGVQHVGEGIEGEKKGSTLRFQFPRRQEPSRTGKRFWFVNYKRGENCDSSKRTRTEVARDSKREHGVPAWNV